MNINPIHVTTVQKNKTKKHKKSKHSKNELSNLSAKSSKTLLKAIKVAKEEANYFQKYYQLNLKNENKENEENNTYDPSLLSSHFQQQFLQTLLKQNRKKHQNINNTYVNVPTIPPYTHSNLFPSTTIPPKNHYQSSQQFYHKFYPSQMNNLNEYSNEIIHNNTKIPNELYATPNAKISRGEVVSNYHPIPQHYQPKYPISSNKNYNSESAQINDKKSSLIVNNNNTQYKCYNNTIPEFNKQHPINNNVKKTGNVKKNTITVNENNDNNNEIKNENKDILSNNETINITNTSMIKEPISNSTKQSRRGSRKTSKNAENLGNQISKSGHHRHHHHRSIDKNGHNIKKKLNEISTGRTIV